MLASVVGSAVAVLAVGGYAAADVLDVAPGILTLDRPVAVPTPTVSGTPSPVTLPSPAASVDPLLDDTGEDAPVPTATGLGDAVSDLRIDADLRAGLGISVLDALTGKELWALRGSTPRVPASTIKLLSALAITDTLDLDATMPTTAVAVPGSDVVVLVVHGDMLMSPNAGNPDAVIGRAGLGDLAAQVAAQLVASGRTSVRLRLDLSWAPGPRYPNTWNASDIGLGFTQAVVMTGLGTQHAHGSTRAPAYPEQEVAKAFAAQLKEEGVGVSITPRSTWSAAAPAAAQLLGSVESATYGEVLGLALDESDNSLTENLVRQAAATAGRPTKPQGANAAYVRARLEAHDVPTSGLVLKDACGLSPGQSAMPRTLSGVLALAATDEVPQLRRAVAGLPVSGLTGTLEDRFDGAATKDVAGVPRAKTGTLRAGSSLAGTTVTADGRPLAYAILVDGFAPGWDGTARARNALDRIVATLTRCGCR